MFKLTENLAKKRKDNIIAVGECGAGLRAFTINYCHETDGWMVYDPISDVFTRCFPYSLASFDLYAC